jgi:hypothetical protein
MPAERFFYTAVLGDLIGLFKKRIAVWQQMFVA